MDANNSISAKEAIRRTRCVGVLAMLIRIGLILSMSAGFVIVAAGRQMIGGAIMCGVIAITFFLATRSMRRQQVLAHASDLIGGEEFEQAEQLLAGQVGAFVMHRKSRHGLLQNLAALHHVRGRFADAGMLARELLASRGLDPASLQPLRLMVAECALAVDDLPGAHAALSQVTAGMPVSEMLKMLELQVDYCVRVNAWDAALDQLPMKVEMAELLPSDAAARLQALCALAAQQKGRTDWVDWLKRRVELLTDVNQLVESRPVLRGLWS